MRLGFVSKNYWLVADTFPFQSCAEGETLSLCHCIFPLCVYTNQVNWQQERFRDITSKLGHFLKQAGFKVSLN